MKQILMVLACLLLFSAGCSPKKTAEQKEQPGKINVAVFDGHGGAQTCIWEAVQAASMDPGAKVSTITTAGIAAGGLDRVDVLIIPGGGGSRQYLNLGPENHRRIKEFVKSGKGILGICAGAYLLSNTPDYACLAMNGAQAIDIEHDNRGHGVAAFTLTAAGKELFPELAQRDTSYVMYYEGPVFVKAPGDSIAFETLAIMESDVHEEGNAPANMTNGKPYLITNQYGSGRVISIIAHPEATPGMRWMIPRMVRWAAGKEAVNFESAMIDPEKFNREILFTQDMLKQEAGYYSTFLYGTSEEKVAALDWLEEHLSWDAKRLVQGLLFDSSSQVRKRAFEYVVNTEYTHYLPDLDAALNSETDPAVRQYMEDRIKELIIYR